MTAIPFNDLQRAIAADPEARAAVERVVRSGRYLLGEETSSFERELAAYLGVDHAIGVASGTDALELAFAALGAKAGQEVLTAANAGGYATAAARHLGLRVRFADVDDGDLLLSVGSVEEALTPQTAVVVVTHLYGKMAQVAAIRDLCRQRGVGVLEDCAQAAGARAHGRFAGSVGDAAAFSFYPTKNLGAIGDGGAVVSSDADVAQRVRRLRQYGWGAKYRVEEPGGKNSRLDEIQAAVLRARLPRLDDWNRRRREIVGRYAEALSRTAVEMVHDGEEDYVAHLAVARTPHRAALAAALAAQGIGTDVHYPVPDHRQPAGATSQGALPVTEAASRQVLSLPCYPALESWELDTICATLTTTAEALP